MKLYLIRAACLVAAAIVFSVRGFAGSESYAQQMVSVSGAEINMRSGPGTRFSALWILGRGYPLRVVGREGDWLKTRDFEGDQGWVFRPLTGQTPHHIVKSKTVNLRARPSTRSRILGRLGDGEILRTLGKRAGWVRVQQESGTRGWVARSLLWGW
jgi:SH3-like domain-containing protein